MRRGWCASMVLPYHWFIYCYVQLMPCKTIHQAKLKSIAQESASGRVNGREREREKDYFLSFLVLNNCRRYETWSKITIAYLRRMTSVWSVYYYDYLYLDPCAKLMSCFHVKIRRAITTCKILTLWLIVVCPDI